ncbi:DNA recombination protein RmuC [Mycoplasmopsis columbina]|uniref:DNA recombination protein RmuC n=1 Tax=Mycoplasmopsis columbina TaxID=114881 RepID=UPI0004A6D27A|nr:DNA recombination protein RmuC [Mycoplasmopsis columbina]VEU77079.1 RmuC family [Mycoplasmopsis columbina]
MLAALIVLQILIILLVLTLFIGILVTYLKRKKRSEQSTDNELKLQISTIKNELFEFLTNKFIDLEKRTISEFEQETKNIKNELVDVADNSLKSQMIKKLNFLEEENTKAIKFLSENLMLKNTQAIDLLNNKIAELFDRQSMALEKIQQSKNDELSAIKKENNLALENINKRVEIELQQIKKEIDEKLKNELAKKIEASFEQSITTINTLTENIGIIQNVNQNITDIKAIFQNSKNYGTFGEKILYDILENAYGNLTNKYSLQYKIKDDSIVDAAVNMYNENGEPIILPIDSKFPVTTYREYNDNPTEINYKKVIESIKERFKEVAKYVVENKTTTHALLFFPSEGIYYFFIKSKDRDDILRKYPKVLPVSPSNIMLYISHFDLFSKAQRISKELKNIEDLFRSIVSSYAEIAKKYNDSKKQQEKALKSLEDLGKKFENINKKVYLQAKQAELTDVKDFQLLKEIKEED